MITKIRFFFNAKIRPKLNSDLRLIFEKFQSAEPFEEKSDEVHLLMALEWLKYTHTSLNEEGFPTKFNVRYEFGLGPSYPETTGYTICTLLTILRHSNRLKTDAIAISKLVCNSYHYLLTCQLENGGFTGGHRKMKNFGTPSIFNTGQILLGLCDLYETLKDEAFEHKDEFKNVSLPLLEERIRRAADFLSASISDNGAYKPEYTFSKSQRSYYSRSTYGLLRASVVLKEPRYAESAKKNFDWVVSNQNETGWIDFWGFDDEWAVLHTISYTLRGLVEAYHHYQDEQLLTSVLNGISFITTFDRSRFSHPELIPSHFNRKKQFLNEMCVTGLSQLAIIIAKLPDESKSMELNELFNRIVSQTKKLQCRGFSNPLMNGVMPASYPLGGKYQGYDLIEWGTKFFMDTLLLNMKINPKEIRG